MTKQSGPELVDLHADVPHLPCVLEFDLMNMEAAQGNFWNLHKLVAGAPSYANWLRDRPPHTKPTDYYALMGGAAGEMRNLTDRFGLYALAARPTLEEQRKSPN